MDDPREHYSLTPPKKKGPSEVKTVPRKKRSSISTGVQTEPDIVIENKVSPDMPPFEFSFDEFDRTFNFDTFFSDNTLSPNPNRLSNNILSPIPGESIDFLPLSPLVTEEKKPTPFRKRTRASAQPAPRDPERPFECDHEGCEASFAQNCTLNRHKQVHMTQEELLAQNIGHFCNEVGCNKFIKGKSDLKRHLEAHARGSIKIKPLVVAESTTSPISPLLSVALTPVVQDEKKNEVPVSLSPKEQKDITLNITNNAFEETFNLDEIFRSNTLSPNPDPFFSPLSPTSGESIDFLPLSPLVPEEKKPTPFRKRTRASAQPASTKPAPRDPKKPFECDHKDCEKSFAKICTLNRHKKVHMTRVELLAQNIGHVCNEVGCDKFFKDKSDFKRHLEAHARGNIKIKPLVVAESTRSPIFPLLSVALTPVVQDEKKTKSLFQCLLFKGAVFQSLPKIRNKNKLPKREKN